MLRTHKEQMLKKATKPGNITYSVITKSFNKLIIGKQLEECYFVFCLTQSSVLKITNRCSKIAKGRKWSLEEDTWRPRNVLPTVGYYKREVGSSSMIFRRIIDGRLCEKHIRKEQHPVKNTTSNESRNRLQADDNNKRIHGKQI